MREYRSITTRSYSTKSKSKKIGFPLIKKTGLRSRAQLGKEGSLTTNGERILEVAKK